MKHLLSLLTVLLFLSSCENTVETQNENLGDGSAGSPFQVQLNDSIKVQTYPNYDCDWYEFEISDSGLLRVEVSNVPVMRSLRVSVNNGYSEIATLPLNNTEVVLFAPVKPGEYGFSAKHQIGYPDNDAVETDYSIFLSMDSIDIYEPNDYMWDATSISISTLYSTRIYHGGDEDFFKFEVDTPSEISINFSNSEDLTYEVKCYVVDSSENIIGNSSGYISRDSTTTVNFSVNSAGEYYLILEPGRYGYAVTDKWFSFQISKD